jgi:hypothetical protein
MIFEIVALVVLCIVASPRSPSRAVMRRSSARSPSTASASASALAAAAAATRTPTRAGNPATPCRRSMTLSACTGACALPAASSPTPSTSSPARRLSSSAALPATSSSPPTAPEEWPDRLRVRFGGFGGTRRPPSLPFIGAAAARSASVCVFCVHRRWPEMANPTALWNAGCRGNPFGYKIDIFCAAIFAHLTACALLRFKLM